MPPAPSTGCWISTKPPHVRFSHFASICPDLQCEQGVFPPGEFSAAMGRRSFHPPKAHMWLEHVYGYAGMLDYTRQSNVFYTHNTGACAPACGLLASALNRGGQQAQGMHRNKRTTLWRGRKQAYLAKCSNEA